MAEERKGTLSKHTVSMEKREKIYITGVSDVLSFDEESIIADTEMGILMLKGENLHVSKLNLDDGELLIEGLIDSLEYTESGNFNKSKGSLLSKIFR